VKQEVDDDNMDWDSLTTTEKNDYKRMRKEVR
jgi:hypothetical protein